MTNLLLALLITTCFINNFGNSQLALPVWFNHIDEGIFSYFDNICNNQKTPITSLHSVPHFLPRGCAFSLEVDNLSLFNRQRLKHFTPFVFTYETVSITGGLAAVLCSAGYRSTWHSVYTEPSTRGLSISTLARRTSVNNSIIRLSLAWRDAISPRWSHASGRIAHETRGRASDIEPYWGRAESSYWLLVGPAERPCSATVTFFPA